ncbi:MAG TPA: radical SAM family heme chaperone HemW [Bryobacteraceae bacterium]|nr:radical SAM family heme chaperone HemW [Bryobacteraceae bacterium]
MSGVYISWPFCAQKCTFCNFASGVQPKGLETDYARALIQEIAAHTWDGTPDTIYLGGGTPSAIDFELLVCILERVPGRPWGEVTIEAAPGTLTAERIRAWKSVGLNRVSLGAQSFVKTELARTGRRHDAQVVEREIAALRAAGITNFNIDLIAGLPGQTESSWRESLGWIAKLQPPHVSVYMFEVDEDSRLGAELLNGGVRYGARDVPPDDTIAELYEIAVDELSRIGIERYEISNFALPGAVSRHNLKYWRREPYAGFGADAHSFDGRLRWQNVETAREYVARFKAQESARADATQPDAGEEKFFVGLRLAEGVETNGEDWRRFGAAFDRLIGLGMMQREGARLRLTARGVMLSNEVFQEFITG